MSEVDKNTAEPTVQEVQEETSNPDTTVNTDTTENAEKPLSEILQVKEEKDSDKPEVDFKNLYKKERKDKRQLEARIKKLESLIEDGASEDEISDDIDDLAEEFNVDKVFLKKLEKSVESKIASRLEESVNSKLKPLEEKEKAQKFNDVFNTYYESALEKMPDFKGVVNKDIIKQLALNPVNANKTISKIIEETYSNALGGRRTIETNTPRGGAVPNEVDFDKARKDPEYFKEVLADPELKRKYNDGLAQRVLK